MDIYLKAFNRIEESKNVNTIEKSLYGKLTIIDGITVKSNKS